MKIAKNNKIEWPKFILPEERGEITVADVLQRDPGEERDMLINKWCISVWKAYDKSHRQLADFLNKYFFT